MSSPDTLHEIAKKGRERWTTFQEGVVADGPDQDGADAYKARYSATVARDMDLPANLKKSLEGLGVTPRKFAQYTTKANGGEDAYVNYYSGDQGVIVAGWNYAAKDCAVDGRRLNLSEILFQEYALEAKLAGKPVSKLRYVVQSSLENQGTMEVIQKCVAGNLQAKYNDTEWGPGTDQFYALLTTDNVKSVPFMLVDHRSAFDHKSILKIVTHGEAYLYLVLSLADGL